MTGPRRRILGALIGGGRSRRFGCDKSDALWQGRTLLDHAIRAIAPACDGLVLCGAQREGLASLRDRPHEGMGPLAGLCAALYHADEEGYTHVLSAPIDVHPLPLDLLENFPGDRPAVLDRHWLIGLWPCHLAEQLERHLQGGERSVVSWLDACGAARVPHRAGGLVNVNTPADLELLELSTSLGSAVRLFDTDVLNFDSGQIASGVRAVPVEVPVAIEFNGVGYAVMMASPSDLEDFAIGFALSEGLADAGEMDAVGTFEAEGGWVVRANLPPGSLPAILDRARTRVSESGCGICGIESIAAALAPLEPVEAIPRLRPAAIHKAMGALRQHQALGRVTGAAHAAAFCSFDGEIVCTREDVGRHNALDKLLGALVRQGEDRANGFVLLSARCSQELVEKTVRAGVPMLVTISAPSSLAITRAREGQLTLLALARSDTALVVNDPHGLMRKDV